MIVSDEDIKLGSADAELLGLTLGSDDGSTLSIDEGNELCSSG